MKYDRSKEFFEQFKKQDVRVQNGFKRAIKIFEVNPNDGVLDNHPLTHDEYIGCRSIDILRYKKQYVTIFKEETIGGETTAIFIAIGEKDDLYKVKKTDEEDTL